jgi:predicted hydrocarbon binding protein
VSSPLCGFYAGLVTRLLAEHGIDGDVTLVECLANGSTACHLDLVWRPKGASRTVEAAS